MSGRLGSTTTAHHAVPTLAELDRRIQISEAFAEIHRAEGGWGKTAGEMALACAGCMLGAGVLLAVFLVAWTVAKVLS